MSLKVEEIEKGVFFDNQEDLNYQSTGYRCHWLGDGQIQCEDICKNEYGSTFGNGRGFILKNQPNPNWNRDWKDIEQ